MFGTDIRLHLDIGPGLAGLFLKLDERRNAKLDAISAKLDSILSNATQGAQTMSALEDALAALGAEVAANTSVDQSAVLAIQGLTQQVEALAAEVAAAGDVPSAVNSVNAFLATLKASNAALAAAIPANTAPAPAPEPAPEPAPAPDAPPA